MQWDHDPAGALAVSNEMLGTREGFAQIERHRYREQPWMHSVFEYAEFGGQDVLEVGVGLGTDHVQFARAGASLTGVDLTPRCIELTRRRFEQEGLHSDLRVMDAEHLEFPDDRFDAVYSFGVLHHTPRPDFAFAEVRRVLKPGGRFIGGLYAKHSFFYAQVMLRRLLSGGSRREPVSERLARIEFSTSDAQPLVRVFGADELQRMLRRAGFERICLRRRHLGLGRFARFCPPFVDDALGRAIGWYLVHDAS
jgi:ubiquinone/menaquinone biosynthesis C-methylase UbiE